MWKNIQLSMIIICSIQILKSCFENAIQRAVTKVFGKEFSLHVNVTPTSMILRIDRGL